MNELTLSKKAREMMLVARQASDLLNDLLMMGKEMNAELAGELRRKKANDNTYEAYNVSLITLSTLLTLKSKIEELILALDKLLWPAICGK